MNNEQFFNLLDRGRKNIATILVKITIVCNL